MNNKALFSKAEYLANQVDQQKHLSTINLSANVLKIQCNLFRSEQLIGKSAIQHKSTS